MPVKKTKKTKKTEVGSIADVKSNPEIETTKCEYPEGEDERPVMLFSNPTFHPGLNITVRRGRKWAHSIANWGNLALVARDTEGDTPDIPILAVDSLVLPFSALRDDGPASALLRFEHDPKCHNYYNLLRVMREMYPPPTPTSAGQFKESDIVTVVFFITVGTT